MTLDWDGYLQLERALLWILTKDFSYEKKIICMDQVIKELGLRLGTNNAPSAETLGRLLTEIRDISIEKVIADFGKLRSDSSKSDLYLAIFIQKVESTLAVEIDGRQRGSGRFLKNVFKQWKGIGEAEFLVFGFRVSYWKLRSVETSFGLEALRPMMDRYLYYLVKRLVGTGKLSIAKRIAIIATNFAMIKWFSRAFACSCSRNHVTEVDLVFAIKTVEKFMSNRLFDRLGEQRDTFSNYIKFLFENPKLTNTLLSRA